MPNNNIEQIKIGTQYYPVGSEAPHLYRHKIFLQLNDNDYNIYFYAIVINNNNNPINTILLLNNNIQKIVNVFPDVDSDLMIFDIQEINTDSNTISFTYWNSTGSLVSDKTNVLRTIRDTVSPDILN